MESSTTRNKVEARRIESWLQRKECTKDMLDLKGKPQCANTNGFLRELTEQIHRSNYA